MIFLELILQTQTSCQPAAISNLDWPRLDAQVPVRLSDDVGLASVLDCDGIGTGYNTE